VSSAKQVTFDDNTALCRSCSHIKEKVRALGLSRRELPTFPLVLIFIRLSKYWSIKILISKF
jgi:hypothetical protein